MAFTKIRALMTKLSDNFTFTGSVTGTTVADNSVTNAKFASTIAASNFSGTLPALDGSALTGVGAATTIASDPTVSTNPAGGLGTLFVNSTSGETYVCTDATAGSNVWTNVGGGSGNIDPYNFQGTQFGYTVSGTTPSASNVVDKYSYSSDGDAADVGNLTVARASTATGKSISHGYCAGGLQAGSVFNDIDKFAFASDADATVVGDTLYSAGYQGSASSSTYGYMAGGAGTPVGETINKWSFSTDGNATDVGDLSQSSSPYAGQSSTTNGYVSGSEANVTNRIDKWSFSTDGNATTVGVLTVGRSQAGGSSSTTHGYTAGGYSTHNVIDRFSFASDGDATDWADLATGNSYGGGSSSTTHGYCAGGGYPTIHNNIHKFSFTSQGNSTDIGNITVSRRYCGGTQF